MNLLVPAAAAATLTGAAAASVVAALRPRRPSFSEVRALLHGPPAHARPAGAGGTAGVGGIGGIGGIGTGRGRAWSELTRRLTDGSLGERVHTRFGSGLQLLGRTPADVVSQVLVGVVVGTATVALCVGALVGGGFVPPSPVWAAVVLAVAPLGALVMWSDTATRVDRRRRELRRAIGDFVQLTSVGLTTDQSVEAAVSFALSVGGGPMFDLLRGEVEAAPARGVPLWEALDAIGARYGERSLCELASSIERQGTHGVSITDTVATLAASIRSAALDQLERDADRANANLSGPTVGFVVATLVFLAYPLALRIGEAFGG